MKYLSLGFSCLTRFTINSISADRRAMPYDWTITTKDFVLQTLTNLDGKEFSPNIDELLLYEMPIDKTQGLGKNGIWFWHDFHRDGKLIKPNWKTNTNFSEKYKFLWQRFLILIRDKTIKKCFVASNCQSNLIEFSTQSSNFKKYFGLDSNYISSLNEKLIFAGAKNFEIIVMNRDIEDFIDISNNCNLNNIRHNYFGSLSLPFHSVAANSLISTEDTRRPLEILIGKYDNEYELASNSFDTLVILDKNKNPIGMAKNYFDGYLFSFIGGNDVIFTAIAENNVIYFSNGTSWSKI